MSIEEVSKTRYFPSHSNEDMCFHIQPSSRLAKTSLYPDKRMHFQLSICQLPSIIGKVAHHTLDTTVTPFEKRLGTFNENSGFFFCNHFPYNKYPYPKGGKLNDRYSQRFPRAVMDKIYLSPGRDTRAFLLSTKRTPSALEKHLVFLCRNHLGVKTVLGNKLLMGAVPDNASFIQHQNPVRCFHR